MNQAIVDTDASPRARLRSLPVSAVRLRDAFWEPRRQTNRTVTLPAQLRHCEETHRLRNFDRAAGKTDAPFEGIFFNDSDVYKWLEAAAWSLATDPDPELDAAVDAVIARVAAAQQPDGYLNTYYMFDLAAERFTNLRDMHEIYCAGHLFQAAVAHHRATGKTSLLAVARGMADHLASRFGDGPGQTPGACGHPEAEMGLVELARATGERRYLDLARHMVSARGRTPAVCGGGRYWQDHAPVTEQREVTGHAVRQLYLAAGVADLLLEADDPALQAATDALWTNFTERRMHVTGGAGARWEGEAFGGDWELTSERAYTETCAAIASVQWNHRLLLLTGDVRYADLIEWTLFNAVLPGLSLDGLRYFYQNPLADRGAHRRKEWFGCACCPPNVARLLSSLPGYFAALDGDTVVVSQYASGTIDANGTHVEIDADYPWSGELRVRAEGDARAVRLRIPAWCVGATVDGVPIASGWVEIPLVDGRCAATVVLPMPPSRLAASPRALALRGQVALHRGPLVYCVESVDLKGVDAWDVALAGPVSEIAAPELLGGVVALEADGSARTDGERPLYGHGRSEERVPVRVRAVPVYAWANREPGPMSVWLLEG